MRVKAEFRPIPPKEFILQITDEVTKGYMYLWDQMDDNFHVVLDWDIISLVYHKARMKKIMRVLGNAGLLYFHRVDHKGLDVELVGWDDVDY